MENLSQHANPLLPIHAARGAEMQRYGQIEIVSTFGQPQAEYAAIHKSCGMMDQPYRGFLEVTGRDRLSFLNGIISNTTFDKQAKKPIAPGTHVYAFMLNLKGRIVCDMNVLELGGRTLLEMDARLVESMKQLFEQYVFSEQVKFASRLGELHQVALYGPHSANVLQHAGATMADPQSSASAINIDGISCVAWHDNPTGTGGLNLVVPKEQVQQCWNHLMRQADEVADIGKRALRPVGWAAFNACRIEAGRALFGIDFDGVPPQSAYPTRKAQSEVESHDGGTGVLPAETGALYLRATALNKCYIGQEIVARMHARQVVARRIVGIRMEGDVLPIAGAPILDDAGDQIGIVTSSTVSPILGNAAICLGFVKRPYFEVGTKLSIPAEGATGIGQVVELPFRR